MNRTIIARLINIMLGIWLMAAPALLAYTTPAATNDRIVGPLVITCATVALWETTRMLRLVNLVLALWLLVAPWIWGYSAIPLFNSTAVGLAIGALALVHGEITGRYGGGWSSLVRS
ncbi:MAG: SPW repeat protein [Caldilineaceae bacterium]